MSIDSKWISSEKSEKAKATKPHNSKKSPDEPEAFFNKQINLSLVSVGAEDRKRLQINFYDPNVN